MNNPWHWKKKPVSYYEEVVIRTVQKPGTVKSSVLIKNVFHTDKYLQHIKISLFFKNFSQEFSAEKIISATKV